MFAKKILLFSVVLGSTAQAATDVCDFDWQTTTGRDSARVELSNFSADVHHLQEKMIQTVEGNLKIGIDLSLEDIMGPGWTPEQSRKVQVIVNYEKTPGQGDYAPLYSREYVRVVDGQTISYQAISAGGSYFTAYLPKITQKKRIHGERYDDVNLLTSDCHAEN